MKIIKKNQIMIYITVLILMIAGYLNYSSNAEKQISLETATQIESKDDMQIADIGDATLVNSNDVDNQTEQQIAMKANVEKNMEEDNKKTNEQNSNEINEQDNNEETQIQTNAEVTQEINDNEYFIKSKLERETMYSQMIETYEKVLNSANSLETQRQSATEEIQKINNIKNSIMICENLIKTKGFENSIIFANGNSINVIIGTDELKTEQIAQIQNIVSREMNAKIENIHITNK